MADPWVWRQPTNQAELLSRLADARDLDVPERECENLCACAFTEIKHLEADLSTARHTIESWQREVGGREADIDRLTAAQFTHMEMIAELQASLTRTVAERDELEGQLKEADLDYRIKAEEAEGQIVRLTAERDRFEDLVDERDNDAT